MKTEKKPEPMYARCLRCTRTFGGRVKRHCSVFTCPWCKDCCTEAGIPQ